MLLLLLPGGYNRPAVQIPGSPFDEAASTVALPYDERSSAKSTRRKNACAMHTTPGGAKKIMLLRRMQVAIRLADQSKLFSMSVLRKAPLCLKPRSSRSWDALSGFGQPPSCKDLKVEQRKMLGIRQGDPGCVSIRPPSLRD